MPPRTESTQDIFGNNSTSKLARYYRLLLKTGGMESLRKFEVLPNLTPFERAEFWRLRTELLKKKLLES